jgi:UDPglucose 6-dehydrogenase
VKVCYSPVFVALGSVLDNLEKPSFILIGGDNAETVEEVASFYTEVGYKDSLIIRTDVLNAEIAKLALNAFLATKITFANFVAAICDRMPGADVNSVLGIIAQDSRVGGGCLRAGPPFGGPCLPRDNEAILNLSERSGVEPILMSAVRNSNEHWYYSLLETVSRQVPSADAVIAVIGLTYKPNTDYTEDGFGLRLAKDLAQRGYKVIAHDPVFDEDHRKTITNFEFCDDINAVLGRSDVCVLTWADEQIAYLVAQATGLICLIDLWGSTQKVKELISPSTSWLSIGKNPLVEGEKSEAIRK